MMSKPTVGLSVLLLAALTACAAADLNARWIPVTGDWRWTREVIPMIRQGSEIGTHVAFCEEVAGAHGAWRATVQPALGANEVGVWIQGGQELETGFLLTLGGNPGLGGFVLRSHDGKALWEDRYAPWNVYQPYVLEGVIQSGKVRAQVFDWDGKTLISQSPWIDVPKDATDSAGIIGLYTRDGIARFWGWERAEEPLSPIVEDAPNKRRLVRDENPVWAIIGPGNWMWTTTARLRLRQYAVIERSSAINRELHGALREWECRLKVDPGAGGAGMLFQVNDQATEGFIAWLGGKFGAGSLMLYRLPTECLWSGKQDNWHYDTEYLLRGETREGEVRAQLLQADGETIIQQTPWVKVSEEEAAREGFMGLMTWRGTAEFWGFSETTTATTQAVGSTPLPGRSPQLGPSWTTSGDGAWGWADDDRTRVRQSADADQAIALNTSITGAMGTWRCHIRVPEGTRAAGLVFQADSNLKEGFAGLLTTDGFRLETLGGRTLWADTRAGWSRGTEYILLGEVMTDRVAMRVLEADAKTLVSECPAVYISEKNNHRTGGLGFITRGGSAEFWDWERQ